MTRWPPIRGSVGAATLAALTALAACDAGAQQLGWTLDPGKNASSLPGDTFLPWAGGPDYYRKWSQGPSPEPGYFPLSVWLQNPDNAAAYGAVGIDTFTGLWMGPTADQLGKLRDARAFTFCDQNAVGAAHLDDPTITAWMQPDGPDNAQTRADGMGYDPCVPPSEVVSGYAALTAKDPTRPIYLGLGRGVAETDWNGRGVCTGHTEMYSEYAKGGDLLAFHIYPRNYALPIELVAAGVDNLRTWSSARKPIIATIEASNINGDARPTPAELRAEVWMALIHGAAGLQYFCHRFMPTFSETDCLDDAPTASALADLNGRIRTLARVLNTPSVANGVTVSSTAADIPVDVMLKRLGGATYLFAVEMRAGATTATFTLRALPASAQVEVLGEGRTLVVAAAGAGVAFSDEFSGYGVHLYRLTY
jgi:hypothetical protein